MGCWDLKPKTEEEIQEQAKKMLNHPLYIKFFKIAQDENFQEISEKMMENPSSRVDYLRLMGK